MGSPSPEKTVRTILASETSQDRPAKRRRKLVKVKEALESLELPAVSKPTVSVLFEFICPGIGQGQPASPGSYALQPSPAPSQLGSRLAANPRLDDEPDENSEAVTSTADLGNDQEGGEIDQRANDAICVACDDGGEFKCLLEL